MKKPATLKTPAKPTLQTASYYDWDAAWEYLKAKYGFIDECVVETKRRRSDLWNYLVENHEIFNGKLFTLSNWELVHEKGRFAYLVPDWYRPLLEAIIQEFGQPDRECTTPGTKTVTFRATW